MKDYVFVNFIADISFSKSNILPYFAIISTKYIYINKPCISVLLDILFEGNFHNSIDYKKNVSEL